jgi:hypothetical protein
MSHDHSVSTQH